MSESNRVALVFSEETTFNEVPSTPSSFSPSPDGCGSTLDARRSRLGARSSALVARARGSALVARRSCSALVARRS